jgi:hypothetical protein
MDFALIARVLSMRRKLRSRERWSADRISAHREQQLSALQQRWERRRLSRRGHLLPRPNELVLHVRGGLDHLTLSLSAVGALRSPKPWRDLRHVAAPPDCCCEG